MNRSRRYIVVGVFVSFLLAGAVYFYYLRLRPHPSESRQIQALLLRAEKAVEAQRPGAVMSCVSRDYHDAHGYTYTSLYRVLAGGLRQYSCIDLAVTILDLRVQGSTATGTIRVHLELTTSEGRIAENDYEVRMQFVKEGRHWRVLGMDSWEPPETGY